MKRMTKSAQPEAAEAQPEDPGRQAAQLLAKLRWAQKTPAQRAAFMAGVAAQRSPEQMGAARRDPHKPRCPCGAMTAKRAKARAHKCVAPAAQRKPK